MAHSFEDAREKPAMASMMLNETGPSLKDRLLPLNTSDRQASTQAVSDLHNNATTTNGPLHAPVEPLGSRTVFYLAYGSNLSAETFLGRRGIKPLSALNVLVPALRLTFDLPGIPYIEPCFGNSAKRVVPDVTQNDSNDEHEYFLPAAVNPTDYHKDRWLKPLVGVVYELTAKDYAHVIATEGGGASYTDIVVDCYQLAAGSDTVPMHPDGTPFKAHTLFAPTGAAQSGKPTRPDPSYAQPSRRYLNLLIAGAAEHGLPQEYRDYLAQIRSYTITTVRQNMGKAITALVWAPLFLSLLKMQVLFQDKKGRNPKWFSSLITMLFAAVWRSYDSVLRPIFGDGERTKYVNALAEETWPAEKAAIQSSLSGR